MTERPTHRLNPTALALTDVAKLLTKVGGESVTEAMLQGDLAAGAPQNADGTLNLLHYTAWILRQQTLSGEG